MRTTHNNGHFQTGLDFTGTSQCLPIIRGKERGYAHQVWPFFCDIASNVLKSSPEMVILVKHGEGAGIRVMVICIEVGKLRGESDRSSAIALVIIPDQNIYIRKGFPDNSLEHTDPQGLETDVCVVKILNWRLEKENFHRIYSAILWSHFGNIFHLKA